MKRFLSTTCSVFCVFWLSISSSMGQATLEARCGGLAQTDFSRITDAATHINRTSVVASGGTLPAFCKVEGYVFPSVGIEIRLPLGNWNGKFFETGCGGYCGGIFAASCDEPLRRGYACIASDMGHKSTALDAKWAYNDLQAEIDFGFRSTHVVAVAGKVITEEFYGVPPSRAYLSGCSTGGRQGMVEAQLFPHDFDGIIAGAPVINETGAGLQLIWTIAANLDEDGGQILPASKVPFIHKTVVARCDKDDGLEDGIIDDPRNCRFDPAELQCGFLGGDDCLSKAQVEVVRKIYSGPHTSAGEKLYTGGALPGSELTWIDAYISRDGKPSVYNHFISDLFRYMGFMPDPGPNWSAKDFDFDEDYKRLGLMEAIYTGSNPDLRRFRDSGGKALIYHGWNDQSVVPLNTIDYYELTTQTMGGLESTQDFFRLFMIPGMEHCVGGPGTDAIDYITAMENWVENGEPPELMIGAHLKTQKSLGQDYLFPLAKGDIEFTRPIYPYPAVARYRGEGEVNDARNWQRKDP